MFFEKPQFFYTSLKNQNGYYDYIYSLKYNEILDSDKEKKVPLSIIIISQKEDPEQFKLLLSSLYHKIIINTFNLKNDIEENIISKIKIYKKLEFINILFFSFSNLIRPPPHSTIRLLFPKSFKEEENPNEIIDFYYHSISELPCNKLDKSLLFLFSILDLNIIIKILFMLLTDKSVELVSSNPSVLSVIIPAFIKLIYPAKYGNLIIPVLPINQLNNKHPKHFYGLININDNYFNNLPNQGCVVIDCDANEMYRYKKYVPFCPLPSSELSKSKNLILRYYKNKIMKYIDDKKLNESEKYQMIKFLDSGKVIIDCDDKNSLVLEHNDNYLSENEYKEIRKEISLIKNKDLNFGGIVIENNENNLINNEDIRNVDYKLSKLFSELIYRKMMDEKDPLAIDIRIQKNFQNFKKEYEFDTQGPQSIMRNTKIFGGEHSFYNSFIIQFLILDFPFEKSKEFLNFIDDDIINTYMSIKNEILKLESDSLKEDDDDDELINKFQLNFYGVDGVISLLNQMKKSIGEKENEFFSKCYNESLYKRIRDILNNSSIKNIFFNNEELNNSEEKKEFIIDFIQNDSNNIDFNKSYTFYLYIALIFQTMKESKLYSDIDAVKFNNQIIQFYNSSYKLKQNNFPYFDFYKFLCSLSLNEMNNLNNNLDTIEPNLQKIFEKVKDDKMEKISKDVFNK